MLNRVATLGNYSLRSMGVDFVPPHHESSKTTTYQYRQPNISFLPSEALNHVMRPTVCAHTKPIFSLHPPVCTESTCENVSVGAVIVAPCSDGTLVYEKWFLNCCPNLSKCSTVPHVTKHQTCCSMSMSQFSQNVQNTTVLQKLISRVLTTTIYMYKYIFIYLAFLWCFSVSTLTNVFKFQYLEVQMHLVVFTMIPSLFLTYMHAILESMCNNSVSFPCVFFDVACLLTKTLM